MVTYNIGRPKRAANHPTRSLEVLKCNLEIALSAAVSVVPKMEWHHSNIQNPTISGGEGGWRHALLSSSSSGGSFTCYCTHESAQFY